MVLVMTVSVGQFVIARVAPKTVGVERKTISTTSDAARHQCVIGNISVLQTPFAAQFGRTGHAIIYHVYHATYGAAAVKESGRTTQDLNLTRRGGLGSHRMVWANTGGITRVQAVLRNQYARTF